jgi:hypothetical protein
MLGIGTVPGQIVTGVSPETNFPGDLKRAIIINFW